MSSSSPRAFTPDSSRRSYIDVARGIAVLLMIEAHTLDAWTRARDRGTTAFGIATILGGFAAPMFLWLAGIGVAFAASRTEQRQGRRAAVDAACRRGLEIFILAFLFRLQAFLLTPGGAPITMFRVDILNVMGPAIVVAGLLWGLGWSPRARSFVLATAATAVAMLTPILRASGAIDALPVWLQWYVRPAGDMTTFTLLPWAAFVLAGGAAGVLMAASHGAAERRLQAALAACGAALIVGGFWAASRPSIYAASSFWTTSPTWFAIRVGVLTLALSAGFFLFPSVSALERFGRASLFVYWVHVELVYGYASWLWRHRLPLWGTAAAYIAFCMLTYRAIGWRDAVVSRWRPPASGQIRRSRRRMILRAGS